MDWTKLLVVSAVTCLAPLLGHTQEKVTFQDHVLPLIENHCSKCHNPDRLKGDLDLTSFNGLMKGGGSGMAVVPGNPEGSKLWKSITHAEEPTMPPNKAKLPEKELEVFRKWIAGGLLQNAGSKAMAAKKSDLDLSLKVVGAGKPEGPPPMPKELSLDPVVHTSRGNPITGLASSPWAPLVALAGQKQVLLYNVDTLDLLGVLPFTNGQPHDLKFSRNAKLLLAAGGHAAKSGKVFLWDITTGETVAAIGEEQDTVLSADISSDQSIVALGGPSRFVKIYSTSTGELLHKIKKHTDWVTSVAFSPNGAMLASADRNGGISIWDPENGQELFVLAGHKGFVTSLSWRDDSRVLASSSEDGTIKWWEMTEGKQAKTWNAHAGGALATSYAHDGQLVSCGRDNGVTLWKADGNKARSLDFFKELPLRAVVSHDGERVVGTDFSGRVAVWNAKDGKRLGELDANPLPLQIQLQKAEQKLKDLLARKDKPSPEFVNSQTEVTRAKAALEEANKAADAAKAEQKTKEEAVAKLKEEAAKAPPALLTQVYPPPELEVKLQQAREARAKARESATNAVQVIEAKKKALATAEAKVQELQAQQPAVLIPAAELELNRIKAAMVQSDLYRARTRLSGLRRERQRLETLVAGHKDEIKSVSEKIGSTTEDEKGKLKQQLKELTSVLKESEAALERITSEANAQEKRAGTLSSEFSRLKSSST